MSRTLQFALTLMALAALAFGSVASTTAGGPKVFGARMAGIPSGAPTLHGLTGGGVAGRSTRVGRRSSPTAGSTSRSKASWWHRAA